MYVCMYICMYVCTYVCMYVCTYVYYEHNLGSIDLNCMLDYFL